MVKFISTWLPAGWLGKGRRGERMDAVVPPAPTRMSKFSNVRWRGSGTQIDEGYWECRVKVKGQMYAFAPYSTEEAAASCADRCAHRLSPSLSLLECLVTFVDSDLASRASAFAKSIGKAKWETFMRRPMAALEFTDAGCNILLDDPIFTANSDFASNFVTDRPLTNDHLLRAARAAYVAEVSPFSCVSCVTQLLRRGRGGLADHNVL